MSESQVTELIDKETVTKPLTAKEKRKEYREANKKNTGTTESV